jgi:N-methylhydantoinase A/oxoprolinase/acetone carboxylase beta subunit
VEHPQIIAVLQQQAAQGGRDPVLGRFAVLQKLDVSGSSRVQQSIIDKLKGGPQSVLSLARSEDSEYLLIMELMRLVDRGFVGISSFTPTDAAHVLGLFCPWSVPAAQLGAEIMLSQAHVRGLFMQEKKQGFSRGVLERVMLQSGRALISAALSQQEGRDLEELHELREAFVDPALSSGIGNGLFEVTLSLKMPLVAIGAPVNCYYPQVAERLHTRLCIPEHAGIANAVGAVAGNVVQTVRVLITLQEDGDCYRVHLSDGIEDFPDLEQAAEHASTGARAAAEDHALRAGAADVHTRVQRNDRIAQAAEDDLFIECEITAVAVGRPRLAMDSD